jgi:NMD protein affecting ribosome stability and mRNA decay
MAGVVSAADIDQDAAADLALRIMRPICQHCLAEARGSRWMAVQAAIADVLHNVQHCGLCGGPPDRVRSFRTDGGLMIVATCSGCEAGRQDGERVDVDADCARFVPDPD